MKDEWLKQAACLGVDGDMFFPTSTGNGARKQAREAQRICATCPVVLQCRERQAKFRGVGVWAGRLYAVEQGRTWFTADDVAPPSHGTEARYKRHYRDGEEPCELCREAASEASRVRRHRRERKTA